VGVCDAIFSAVTTADYSLAMTGALQFTGSCCYSCIICGVL